MVMEATSDMPIASLTNSICRRLRRWPLYVTSARMNIGAAHGALDAMYGFRAYGDVDHFAVEIINGVMFINSISVRKEQRGKGHGAALYELLEQVARDMDCKRIEMSASGWTIHRETRRDWCIRKLGYSPAGGIVVFKDLD